MNDLTEAQIAATAAGFAGDFVVAILSALLGVGEWGAVDYVQLMMQRAAIGMISGAANEVEFYAGAGV